jgi:hypothetical protein
MNFLAYQRRFHRVSAGVSIKDENAPVLARRVSSLMTVEGRYSPSP